MNAPGRLQQAHRIGVIALRAAQLQYLKTRGADAPARLWSGFAVFTA